MPIEFKCPSCGKNLRVPDESGGKKARCPQCQQITAIPLASIGGAPPQQPSQPPQQPSTPPPQDSLFSDPSPLGSASVEEDFNPYRTPAGAEPMAGGGPTLGGAIGHRVVTVDEVFSYAWNVWKENLGLLVGVTFVVMIISGAAGGATEVIEQAALQAGGLGMYIIVALACFVGEQVLQSFLWIGQIQIFLKLARGQRAEFSDLFSGGPYLLPMIGIWFLMTLAITAGLVLLIVPGIILALMWWPTYYLIAEGRCGVMESFSIAGRITQQNWGAAFVLFILSILLIIAGLLACCVGVLFAAPLCGMMFSVAYLMMSNQIGPARQF